MEDPVVFAIQGQAWLEGGSPAGDEAGEGNVGVLIFVMAPDEDGAVKRALEALAEQGYVRCEFDRIGLVSERPDDADVLEAAYGDALDGHVAIITLPVNDE